MQGSLGTKAFDPVDTFGLKRLKIQRPKIPILPTVNWAGCLYFTGINCFSSFIFQNCEGGTEVSSNTDDHRVFMSSCFVADMIVKDFQRFWPLLCANSS